MQYHDSQVGLPKETPRKELKKKFLRSRTSEKSPEAIQEKERAFTQDFSVEMYLPYPTMRTSNVEVNALICLSEYLRSHPGCTINSCVTLGKQIPFSGS